VLQKTPGLEYYPAMALRDYEPQNAILAVRLRESELKTIKKAAKAAGISMADAVRDTMLAWAKRGAMLARKSK
jgi:predicted DNA binding CopG/RHH family protein